MKTILVPFDFSKEANNAFEFAKDLAIKAKAKLKMIHIVELPTSQSFNTMGEVNLADNEMNQVFMIELVEKRKQQMETIKNQYKNAEFEFSSRIVFGNPYAGISAEVTDIKADLIVMGSKGSSGMEEFLIGSNTEKVVRHSKCPVITVKHPVKADDIRKIVFASDFEDENEEIIGELKIIQNILAAEVTLVKINTPSLFENSKDSKARIGKFVEKQGLSNINVEIYNSSSEEEGIIEYAEEINADMIAMATHGRTGFMHLISGSIAEDVVNHAKRPVWTMRKK
ncbi:universal stress protein [Anditalea andensis]|uniref:Universal stress protein n=1 Tax=Anditalea andensis TaxID=1048983 RepID=A0A074KY13_9BACT|nr:universal stress protein [Anditalea andensis]KEO72493.1 universal stress protein [Anditalea andensis]